MPEPANRQTDDRGGKFYTHPFKVTPAGDPERFISVTTVLGVKNKPGLKWWAAKGAARRAMENLPQLIKAARVDPCGKTGGKGRCDSCYDCTVRWIAYWHFAESKRRIDEGRDLHDWVEQWVTQGGVEMPVRQEVQPFVDQFKFWVEDYGLEPESWLMAEATVLNRAYGYAGTLDGILRIRTGRTPKADAFVARVADSWSDPPEYVDVVFDKKTRGTDDERLYDEMALQLAAYRHCAVVLLKDGTERPLPDVHGAAVFQPRPTSERHPERNYTFEPVVADANTFHGFLGALQLYLWENGLGASSVNGKTFPVPIAAGTTAEPSKPAKKATKAAKKATPGKSGQAGEPAAASVTTSATLDSLRTSTRVAGAQLDESDIPF